MKILVVGSFPERDTSNEDFNQACRQLGTALGQAGLDLIIGSDSAKSADRYVIEGMAKADGRPKVHLWQPEDWRTDETPLDIPADKVEILYRRLRGPWSAGYVTQVQAADAVIVIGGFEGVRTAGYVALALEKPVLCIASFGGSAAELWPQLEPLYQQIGELSTQIGALRESWRPENAALAARAVQELVKRRTFRKQPRLPAGVYSVVLLALLVGWVYLFTNPFSPVSYSFFAMVALAGLLGTFLRNNLRLVLDVTAQFKWNELFIEIGTGLLLGFALVLLYLVGALTVTGSAQTLLLPDSDADYQRVGIVMTLLGLGGGFMIEQAANRVRGWFSHTFESERN